MAPGLVEAAAPHLWGLDQVAWLDQLEQEHANLCLALDAALQPGASVEQVQAALRIAGAPWPFWDIRGHLRQARDTLERLLALPSAGAPTSARAQAMDTLGWVAYAQGDLQAPTRP